MTTTYNIRKFDPLKMKTNPTKSGPKTMSVIIGKRNTGKTVLVKDLLWHNRDIPMGTVISPKEEIMHEYNKIIPPVLIHEQYSDYFLDNIIKRQQILIKRKDADIKTSGKSDIDARIFTVLDDCIYEAGPHRNKILRQFFTNARYLNITSIITMQYPLGIGPELRCNVDYVFLLRTSLFEDRIKLYNHYAGMFPSFEVFSQVMDQCTKDYSCLVIDNTIESDNWEDKVFWYKADIREDCIMYAPHLWQLSERILTDRLNTDLAITNSSDVKDYEQTRAIAREIKNIECALSAIKKTLGEQS